MDQHSLISTVTMNILLTNIQRPGNQRINESRPAHYPQMAATDQPIRLLK